MPAVKLEAFEKEWKEKWQMDKYALINNALSKIPPIEEMKNVEDENKGKPE